MTKWVVWALLGHFWIAFLVVDLLGDLLEDLVGDVQAPLLPTLLARPFIPPQRGGCAKHSEYFLKN